jgi:hypothetical protein
VKNLALTLLMLISLAACEDRYRYFCQNPANWAQERCQRPKCLFTQDCPDYLVAPILEKQNVVQQTPAPAASSDR